MVISIFTYTYNLNADDIKDSKKTTKQTTFYISLPDINNQTAKELVKTIKDELGSLSYKRESYDREKFSEVPDKLEDYDVYIRKQGDTKKIVKFGVINYLTRSPRMWIEALIKNQKTGEISYNNDIEDIKRLINEEVIQDLNLENKLTKSRIPSILVPLPQLTETQLFELINSLNLEVSLLGYSIDDSFANKKLPPIPPQVITPNTFVTTFDDRVRIIRVGIVPFSTIPTKLWIEGLDFTKDGKVLVNSDIDIVKEILKNKVLKDLLIKTYKIDSLEKKTITLSYASSTESIISLKAQGYTAFSSNEKIPKFFSYDELPVIIEMPTPDKEQTGLVGDQSTHTNNALTTATRINSETVSSEMGRLLVIYHPDHKEQYEHITKDINDLIDRPARQVLIEGMVLEISETGLKELGIEWQVTNGENKISIMGGSISATLNKTYHDIEILKDWKMILQMLIQEGRAEVLSRPSVLTLDNRQATIRIGQDEPIAKTTTTDNSTSTSFEYLSTGILLNVRPKVSSDGETVSMAIDTTVSQIGETVKVTDPTDHTIVLAQAPRVSTRRVQTYATITNNAPFIIGGLISRDKKTTESKTPYLSAIPLIGKLFNYKSDTMEKREVIIVLTPYVLPERDMSQTTPKDDEVFDSLGNQLFRSSYRMKKRDLTDLSFLTENPRFKEFRNIAQKLADYGSPLAKEAPFKFFVNGRVPGERIIVQKIIYSLLMRQGIDDKIDLTQLKYFKDKGDYGFEETPLSESLKQIQRDIPEEEYTWWEKLLIFLKIKTEDTIKDKYKDNGLALTLTYTVNHDSIDMKTIFNEPVPETKVIKCPDRRAWSDILRESNKQNLAGQTHHTIVINNKEDIARLKVAILMKEIILQNGGIDKLKLDRLKAGKQLLLPDFKKGQSYIIDAEVARYFVNSNYYYKQLITSVEGALNDLINALQKLFLHTSYEKHGLTRQQLSKIGLATPIDIYLKANKPTTRARFAVIEPIINGLFDDQIWHTTEVISDFVETKTRTINNLTSAQIAYDDNYLYFSIRCKEPELDNIKADAKKEEEVLKDDFIEIAIAPTQGKKFYQFMINPNNMVADYEFDGKPNIKYVSNIITATKHTKEGWNAEIAIPWAAINSEIPTSKTKMGLLLYRNRVRAPEEYQFPFLNGSNLRSDFYGILTF
jgi:Flp pilus assembly secretin CpaC